MSKKIDNKKYERYVQLKDARKLLDELEQPDHCESIKFFKANQAIDFLKSHIIDNEFELENATSAINMAIDYLTGFELELKAKMIAGIAEDERRKKVAEQAGIEARKQLSSKIEPAAETLIAELEKLNEIEGYSAFWLRKEFEAISDQIRAAARLVDSPRVFIAQ